MPGRGDGGPVAAIAPPRSIPGRWASSARELPRVFMDTSCVPPLGQAIVGTATGDFQAVLNRAKPGGLITLGANLDAIAAPTKGVAVR